jgi:DNA end-binding protein Ku
MARSLWKGAISFGLVNVPVELYSAQIRAGKRAGLDLTMLDRRDMAPVGFQRVNKETGEEVPWAEVVKGYEYRDGRYVVLGDEDFRRANPEASRTIDIVAFVGRDEVLPTFFETPYYLAPEKRGAKAYALLRETLEKSGKVGIATFVLRSKQHLAALFPQDDILVLNTLRYAEELKSPAELEVKSTKATGKELDMALRLVEDMSGPWTPAKFKDTFRADILKRVKAKVKAGETEEVPEPEKEKAPKGEVIDLMAALRKSVEKKQPARKRARKERKSA